MHLDDLRLQKMQIEMERKKRARMMRDMTKQVSNKSEFKRKLLEELNQNN